MPKKSVTAEGFAAEVMNRLAEGAYGQPRLVRLVRQLKEPNARAFFDFHCGAAFAKAAGARAPRKARKEKPLPPTERGNGVFEWLGPMTKPAPGGYARPLNGGEVEHLKATGRKELAKVGCEPELTAFRVIDDHPDFGKVLACSSRPQLIELEYGAWNWAGVIRDGNTEAAEQAAVAALAEKGVAKFDVEFENGPTLDAGPVLVANGLARGEEEMPRDKPAPDTAPDPDPTGDAPRDEPAPDPDPTPGQSDEQTETDPAGNAPAEEPPKAD